MKPEKVGSKGCKNEGIVLFGALKRDSKYLRTPGMVVFLYAAKKERLERMRIGEAVLVNTLRGPKVSSSIEISA